MAFLGDKNSTIGKILDKGIEATEQKEKELAVKYKNGDTLDKIGAVIGEIPTMVAHAALDWLGADSEDDKKYIEARAKAVANIKKKNNYLKELPDSEAVQVLAQAPEYKFDYEGALKAGYTPQQILDYVKNNAVFFKIDKARKAGLTDDQILQGLMKRKKDLENFDISERIGRSGFTRGLYDALANIYQQEVDLGNLLGIVNDDNVKQINKDLHNIHKTVEETTDTSLFSSFTAGKLLPFMATLPATAEGRLAVYVSEKMMPNVAKNALYGAVATGTYSYGENRLEGDSQAQAGKDAMVDAAIGGALNVAAVPLANKIGEVFSPIFGNLSAVGARKAKLYLKSLHDFTDSEIKEATKQYLKYHESTGLKDADEALAMLYAASKDMQKVLTETENKFSIATQFNKMRKQKIETLRQTLSTNYSAETFSNTLRERIKAVKDKYSLLQNKIVSDYDHLKIRLDGKDINDLAEGLTKLEMTLPEEILSSLQTSHRHLINTLRNPEGMTLAEVTDVYRDLNNIIRRTSPKDKLRLNKLYKVKDKLNNIIRDNLKAKDLMLWDITNKEYAKVMNFITNDKLGKKLYEVVQNKKSPEAFSRMLINTDFGADSFKQLGLALGSDKYVSEFEKYIIKQSITGHLDNISYDLLARNINKQGFITKEGQAFQELVKEMSDVFRLEDLTKGITHGVKEDFRTSGSASLILKTMSGILNWVFSKGAYLGLGTSKTLNELRIARLLKNTKVRKDFLEYIKTMPKNEFNTMMEEVRREAKNSMRLINYQTSDYNLNNAKSMTGLPDPKDLEVASKYNAMVTKGKKYKENIPEEQYNLLFWYFNNHTINKNGKDTLILDNIKIKNALEQMLGTDIKNILDIFDIDDYTIKNK